MSGDPQLSLVIPCFNEEESIPHLLAELDTVVAGLASDGRTTEVLLVDDGSADKTAQLLADATDSRDWLRLLQLRRNYGQTAALSAGIEKARGEYVIAMDADLQNDPADIPAMLERLGEGYDVVCGWRKKRKDPFFRRKIPSWLANKVISRVAGLRLHDYGCTLKVFKREFIKGINLYGEMHRFLPLYAKWEGARITEMAVNHRPRKYGQSKYGLERIFKVLLDLVTVKLLGDYSTKPIYLFGRIGLFSCFLGMLAAGGALLEKFLIDTWVHKNPLALLAVLLFVVGIQLIGMGLLAELQIRTYHESQQKPTYRIHREVSKLCAASRESLPQPATQSTPPP